MLLVNMLETDHFLSKKGDPFKTKGSLFGLFGSEKSRNPNASGPWERNMLLIDHNSVDTISLMDEKGRIYKEQSIMYRF